MGHRFNVMHHNAFGQFKIQLVRVQAGLGQNPRDQQGHGAFAKLHGGHVDADAQGWLACARPCPGFLTGRFQHPFIERDDHPVFFGAAKKRPRGNKAVPGAIPAYQSFGPDNGARRQIKLRLIIQHELFFGQGGAQFIVENGLVARAGLHVDGVKAEQVAALAFGLVHRKIGIFQQVFRITAIAGVQGNADAGRGGQRLAFNLRAFHDVFQHALGKGGGIFGTADIGL